MENDKNFSIGDVARTTGVTMKSIRNWEARGFIPVASRAVCGERAYRRFSMNEVENIRKIREFLDEGFTLSSAVNKTAGKNSIKEDSDK